MSNQTNMRASGAYLGILSTNRPENRLGEWNSDKTKHELQSWLIDRKMHCLIILQFPMMKILTVGENWL